MTGSLPLPIPEEAELLRHVDFVRRLARGIATDGASADDLAQETWLATLERPAGPSGSLRAWLARVLRNRAALALRRGERRARREADHGPAEPSAPTADMVERMELHGRVVTAVLALPAEQREVVVRRYFAGESTHEIAHQLGLPEPTVRTRLTRAHERLRQRLEAHFGGSRALTVMALTGLAREGAPAPALVSSPASIVLSLAMKKTLAVIALAVLAILAVWSSTRERARGALTPETAGEPEAASAAVLAAPAVQVASAEREELAPATAAAKLDAAPRAKAEKSPAPAVAPGADPETAWLEFHVHDRQGFPIPEAKVRIECYRTIDSPGSSQTLQDMPSGTTDLDGVARLAYPRHVGVYGGPERTEISAVCYVVEHPDFVTVNEWDFEVEKSPAEVVLRHGALLIVAGFLGQRALLVTDVVPHVSDEAMVESGDWVALADGRPSCNRLPPGRHGIYLTREGEGGTWASAAVEFELAGEEVKEVTLELLPPRTLVGHLDPLVPRPVRNGEVLLNIHFGRPGDRQGPRGFRLFRAEVQPDGSFEIPGLPPGGGEMIGMCDGWVSRELEVREGAEDAEALRLQQVAADGPFVLAMERTARLEFLVLDPHGEPVEGARLDMWPNVHWSNGYSQIFLDRKWLAVSDKSGQGEIENIPAGMGWIGLTHPKLCLPLAAGASGLDRRAFSLLVSGETATIELELEPRK